MTPTRAGDYLFERIGPLREQLADVCRNVALVREDKEHIEVPCAYGTLHLLYAQLTEFASATAVGLSWEEANNRTVERRVLSGQSPMGLCTRN